MVGTQLSRLGTLGVTSLCLQTLSLHCVIRLCSLDHITIATARDRPSIGDRISIYFANRKCILQISTNSMLLNIFIICWSHM